MSEYQTGDKLSLRWDDGRSNPKHDFEYVSTVAIRHHDGNTYLGHLVRYPGTDDFLAYTADRFRKTLRRWTPPPPPYPFKLGDRIKVKGKEVSSNTPVYTVMRVDDDGYVLLAFVGLSGKVSSAHSNVLFADDWELAGDGDR